MRNVVNPVWADNKDLDAISVFPDTNANAFDSISTASFSSNKFFAVDSNSDEISFETVSNDLKT